MSDCGSSVVIKDNFARMEGRSIPPAEPKVKSNDGHDIDIRCPSEPNALSLRRELDELKRYGFVMPWTCITCTFLNESFPSICELCATKNQHYKEALGARVAVSKEDSAGGAVFTFNPGPPSLRTLLVSCLLSLWRRCMYLIM